MLLFIKLRMYAPSIFCFLNGVGTTYSTLFTFLILKRLNLQLHFISTATTVIINQNFKELWFANTSLQRLFDVF